MDINHYLKSIHMVQSPFASFKQPLDHPIELFQQWFKEAYEAEIPEPNAMVLSTSHAASLDSRIVLLKAMDDAGFYFETGKDRKKVHQLKDNSQVALNLYWPTHSRQIRIQGKAELTSDFSHVADNLDAATRDLNVYHVLPEVFEFYQGLKQGGYTRVAYTLENEVWQHQTL